MEDHYKAMLLTSALKLSHGHSVISEKQLEMDGRWTLVTVNLLESGNQ